MLASDNELGQHDSLDLLRLTIEDLTLDLPEAHKLMIQLRIEGYAVSEIAEKRLVPNAPPSVCCKHFAHI